MVSSSRNLLPLHCETPLSLFEVIESRPIGHPICITITRNNLSIRSIAKAQRIHWYSIWCSFHRAGHFVWLQEDCKSGQGIELFQSQGFTYCACMHKPCRYLDEFLIRQLCGNSFLVVNWLVKIQLLTIVCSQSCRLKMRLQLFAVYLPMLPEAPARGPTVHINCTSVPSPARELFPFHLFKIIWNCGAVKSVQTPASDSSFIVQCARMAFCGASLQKVALFCDRKLWNTSKPSVEAEFSSIK